MNELDFIGKIQNELYLKGGFSFNFYSGFNPPKSGYMVGGIAEPLICNSIEELKEHKIKILKYLVAYAGLGENKFLGGWKNTSDGKIYIEPSELFNDLSWAILIGRERDQVAIYDLRKGENILLKEVTDEN